MEFPTTTGWKVIESLKGQSREAQQAALQEIISTYGPPLLAFALRLRNTGTKEDCEDLVNDYFVRCMDGKLFEHADRSRGRFRTFLIASFKHFVSNANRASRAKKRRPEGGEVVSLELLTDRYGFALEPKTRETPEAVFERVWRQVLFDRALATLQQRCHAASNDRKYQAFRAREIEPTDGAGPEPSYASLADRFGATANALNKAVLAARAELREIVEHLLIEDGLDQADAHLESRLVLGSILGE
jgi:RNA polymerase sigma factor (sigma-70 family)